MRLNDTELLNIRGGAIAPKHALLLGIGGLITLLVGVIDGYVNPQKCNMRKIR